MAKTETIIWTAVPNGVSAGELQISIHVAPTLSGGPSGTLTDFPDFQNWPDTFTGQSLEFALTFSNQNKSQTQTAFVQIDSSVLNAALWKSLFSPAGNIAVDGREAGEPYTKIPVVSYPANHVAGFLQDTYTNLAITSPNALPAVQNLQKIYGPLGHVGTRGLETLKGIYDQLSNERLKNPTGGPAPFANDFSNASTSESLAALRFYHLPPQGPAPVAALPKVDFHRALTFIGEHRTLQRALGLVFDVSIPTRAVRMLTGSLNSNFYVAAVPGTVQGGAFTPSTGVTYTPVSPRTHCDASDTVFQPHAATSQIAGRQLTLGDSNSFLVHEIDIDGGGLKTAQFADNVALTFQPQPGAGNFPAPDAPTALAPPSLRSVGLTVTAVNRGLKFVSRLGRSSDLLDGLKASPPSVPDLTAEDLVRGFVLDVFDAGGGAWHSTAMRDVTYDAGASTLNVTDEASTDAPPRMQTDPTNPAQPQMNLPENLIRWSGWSNGAPRPGLPIQDDGGTAQGGTDPGPFSQLKISVKPTAGSLPRLRFGESYALRARVVDVAGNVIPLSDGANVGDALQRVSPRAAYGRHQPVGSPDVYLRDDPRPGESLKRLVIRDLDAAAGSLRTLAPQHSAEQFAEIHGMFDLSSGALDHSAYPLIVARESARYPETGPISLTDPVPYLPDPICRGGALKVLSGPLVNTVKKFDFSPASGKRWPDFRPFGLELKPGASQAINVDTTGRLVTFTLTRADVVQVQLSSILSASDLKVLGLYSWVSLALGGSIPAAFQQDTLDGQHWGTTPFDTLELVFAVQKPLVAPEFPNLGPGRALDQTYAQVSGDITYSPKSTSKTDLLANWAEPADGGPGAPDPQGPGAPNTALIPVHASAFTIPSADNGALFQEDRFSGRHEWGDTKHRNVTYFGKATSRFTEHYAGQATIVVSDHSPHQLKLPGLPDLGLEPGSVKVTSSDGAISYVEGFAFKIDPSAGTITFLPTGPALGSTVLVSFLPPVSVQTAHPVTVNVLSSARPHTPKIHYIVPIYDWQPIAKHGRRTTSGRSPSALRVFLNRPWWSSGIDELLGVTTYPGAEGGGTFTIPKDPSLYVTDWGADPVFGGHALPSAHPRLNSFPNAVKLGANLSIEERSDVLVHVAGHPVTFDSVRKLWYCDIRVDIGRAYTPMIRLAIARYQPNSVPGAELSRIVLADVMSLEPGRSVVIQRKSKKLISFVTLTGYSYKKAGADDHTGPGYAQLIVERRNPAIADPALGWQPVGDPIKMSAFSSRGGQTTWAAREIKIPDGGTHRLLVEQYEVVPEDNRKSSPYILLVKSRGYRLLYQDVIPL